jgi:hypothetical protein
MLNIRSEKFLMHLSFKDDYCTADWVVSFRNHHFVPILNFFIFESFNMLLQT